METTTKMLTIDPSTPILPSWANAAVYFVREAGEYIFAARKDDRTISKFLRPADVKAAFTHQEDDTGWIGTNVVRIGNSSRGPWFIYRRGAERVPICFDGDRNKYLIPIPPTIFYALETTTTFLRWITSRSTMEQNSIVLRSPTYTITDGSAGGPTTLRKAMPRMQERRLGVCSLHLHSLATWMKATSQRKQICWASLNH